MSLASDEHRPSNPGPSDARTLTTIDATSDSVVVSGRAVDWRGWGVEGARIELSDGSEPGYGTTADRQGSFQLVVPAGRVDGWVLSADGEYCKPFELLLSEQTTDLLLRLKPERATVTGRVLDAETGMGIAGAEVATQLEATVSSNEGRFRLDGVPIGVEFSLRATKAGYAGDGTPILLRKDRPTDVDVLLHRTMAVRVEVFDRLTGRPIEGAEVRARESGDLLATTDSTGCFAADVVPGAVISRYVTADGYGPFLWTWEPVSVDPGVVPRLPLQANVEVLGVAVDSRGSLVPDVAVSLNRPSSMHPRRTYLSSSECGELGVLGSGAYLASSLDTYTKSDVEGRFRLAAPACDEPYVLYVVHEDYVSQRVEPLELEVPGDQISVTIELETGATITGRVAISGKPFAGIDVVGGGAHARTNPKGEYVLTRVEPGIVRLATVHGQETSLSVEAGKTYEHDFLWDDQRRPVRGKVGTADGEPLEWVHVRGECGGQCADFPTFTRTDENGEYLLLLGEHEHDVSARHGVAEASRSAVLPGATGVDFVLPATTPVLFQLVDSTTRRPVGEPSARLYWGVSARLVDGREFRAAHSSLDSQGLLEVRLPLGSVDLYLHLAELGYAPQIVRAIHVTKQQADTPQVITLERGFPLELRIEDYGSYAAARVNHVLFLLERSQEGMVRGPFERQGPPATLRINGVNVALEVSSIRTQLVSFDRAGVATLNGLQPGTYSFRCLPDDLVFTPASIEVGPGNPSSVDVQWRVQ